jgi:hypothetical protein
LCRNSAPQQRHQPTQQEHRATDHPAQLRDQFVLELLESNYELVANSAISLSIDFTTTRTFSGGTSIDVRASNIAKGVSITGIRPW